MADGANKKTHAARRREEFRDAVRIKLRAGQYVRRLREIAEKAETVDPSAIPALRLKMDIYSRLLAKCLPDLKAIEHTGEINHQHATELTREELIHIAATGSTRAIEASGRDSEPPELH